MEVVCNPDKEEEFPSHTEGTGAAAGGGRRILALATPGFWSILYTIRMNI